MGYLRYHHIIPKFVRDDLKWRGWNQIILSYDDHTEAHRIRYEVYGDVQDAMMLLPFVASVAKQRR
jgi:hypothetical protein